MSVQFTSADDKARIQALESYEVLDTLAEEEFDALTRLASYICGTPIAAITLLDDRRQWFKSVVGLDGVTETPREFSFCQHALWSDDVLEIPDALEDDRFRENPLVTGHPDIRFYAGAPLETPDGFNLGTLCVIDQVPRKLTPDQIDALKTIAEQVMAQLELRKQNKVLEHEKKVIEQLSIAKETFYSNMSHEIRTPLNAIIGFTDVLLATNLSPVQQEYVSNILYGGQKLMLLINDLMDLSKISSGSMHLEQRAFSLRSVLPKNYALFKQTAIEKGLEYKFDFPTDLPDYVIGDELRLSQILMNLINNAFKFTENGSVHVNISQSQRTDESITLNFSIRDTGIGISQENLKRIFWRFQQADSGTTRNYGGTGLGLNIAASIVKLYGGRLEVQSEPGVGSNFYFSIAFPIFKGEVTFAESNDVGDANAFYRILLCEDVILNQKLIQSILAPDKFHLRVASNGLEGLEWLKQEEFDVILMDLQMPKMNGYEATKKIRKELKLDIPIIALTAHSMEGDMQKCFDAGMTDYISKPFRIETLLRKIRQNPAGTSADEFLVESDLTYLRSISGGNKAFEKSMLESFLEEAEEEVTNLKHARSQEDVALIARVAHKLKSTVAFGGLEHLIPLLDSLQNTDDSDEKKDQTLQQTAQLIGQFEKQFENLRTILKTEY